MRDVLAARLQFIGMNDNTHSARQDEYLRQAEEAALAPPSVSFFQRTDWLCFWATAVLALCVYLATLAPDVTLGFSGIFSAGAMYAGVPHPPGYPLWTLYAWVFIKLLPFSNIAWRVAVSSAVAAALACGVIALMVSRGAAALAGHIPGLNKPVLRNQMWLRALSGYGAGLVFGFNGCFWRRAVVADVWPLSILMLCLGLCLLMRWSYTPGRRRYLYAAFLIYGLTLTNSQMLLAATPALPFLVMSGNRALARDMFLVGSILFLAGLGGAFAGYVPSLASPDGRINSLLALFLLVGLVTTALGVGLAIRTRRLFTEWKTTLVCGALCLLGLALYFYPPLASMTNPPMNWAYPRSVPGFFHLLSRSQYERIVPTDDAIRFLHQVWMYVLVMGKEFGWPYLLVIPVPFWFWRRLPAWDRGWMFGLLAVYVCLAFLVLAVLNPGGDRRSYEPIKVFFSASYVVLAVWMGYGLVLLGVLLIKPSDPMSESSPPTQGRSGFAI